MTIVFKNLLPEHEVEIFCKKFIHFKVKGSNILERMSNWITLQFFKYWVLCGMSITITIKRYFFTYVHYFEPKIEFWTGLRVWHDSFDIITPIGQFSVIRKRIYE
jgi:hypothetical protein